MLSPVSTPYIDMLDYSSAGALQMSCIEPCYPLQFSADEPDDQAEAVRYFMFPLCSQSDGTHAFVGVCIPEVSSALELNNAQTSRLLCHFLVQHLPDLAFEEAIESLAGMYEFYRESPPELPAPLQNPSVKARVMETYTAPVYPISEE